MMKRLTGFVQIFCQTYLFGNKCFIDNDCWELMVDCCSAVRQKYTSKGQDSKVLSRDVVMFMCRVPDITIATDVICGFPTETVEVWVTVLCLL